MQSKVSVTKEVTITVGKKKFLSVNAAIKAIASRMVDDWHDKVGSFFSSAPTIKSYGKLARLTKEYNDLSDKLDVVYEQRPKVSKAKIEALEEDVDKVDEELIAYMHALTERTARRLTPVIDRMVANA